MNKFVNRSLGNEALKKQDVFQSTPKKLVIDPNITIKNKFSEIITSYQQLKSKNAPKEPVIFKTGKAECPPNKDTYVMDNNKRYNKSNLLTIDRLQEKLEQQSVKGTIAPYETTVLHQLKEKSTTTDQTQHIKDSNEIVDLIEQKYTSRQVSIEVRELSKQYNFLVYPRRIRIPWKLFKRGRTYKLNDCYYDDDGTFLYRVPGMDK